MNLPIGNLQSVVDRMKSIAGSVNGKVDSIKTMASSMGIGGADSADGVKSGFGAALDDAIKSVNDAQMSTASKVQDIMNGKPGVSLSDVMIDIQKANVGFQTIVQMRNKVVQAYQSVSSMPV